MPKASRRLPCLNYEISIIAGKDHDGNEIRHMFDVSLAYDEHSGLLREVVFVGRGKVGHGIDIMFHDLGIKLSRAIQGRDPETGNEIYGKTI